MSARIFDNQNALPLQTVVSRIKALDPLAIANVYNVLLTNGVGVPVGGFAHYVGVESTLTDAQITGALAAAQTAQEAADLTNYQAARLGFLNVPNWATWSPSEVQTNINNAVLSGMTQAQVDSYITTTATNLAGAVTVLHQIGAALVTIRGILIALGQAVVYLRDLLVRFS